MEAIFHAVLGNPKGPEYGVATIPFPLPRSEYAHSLEILRQMGIGDPREQDCLVTELHSDYHVLRALNGQLVNMDELDYLAKRLDSFCVGEDEQFQALAAMWDIHSVKDFINLTFCCQGVTVISDFSNLEQAGKYHAMNIHGGSMPLEEYNAILGEQVALELIAQGNGIITPYGVLFDNGVMLEEQYTGHEFPEYLYDGDAALQVSIGNQDNAKNLFLPMPEEQLERFILRAGQKNLCPIYRIQGVMRFEDLISGLDMSCERLHDLNRMCLALAPLDKSGETKLQAICKLAEPIRCEQIERLAQNLDLFDFVEGVSTAEEYGRYMICESGRFDYDPNLEPYYNFEEYGQNRINNKLGTFTEEGFVSYEGRQDIEELMNGEPTEDIHMGGIN